MFQVVRHLSGGFWFGPTGCLVFTELGTWQLTLLRLSSTTKRTELFRSHDRCESVANIVLRSLFWAISKYRRCHHRNIHLIHSVWLLYYVDQSAGACKVKNSLCMWVFIALLAFDSVSRVRPCVSAAAESMWFHGPKFSKSLRHFDSACIWNARE